MAMLTTEGYLKI